MDSFTAIYNILMAIGAVGMGIVAILLFILVLIHRGKNSTLLSWINTHLLVLGFSISLFAIIGSLIYSNVIGYPPCLLCWYARIFVYPQAILYGRALYLRDQNIIGYTWILTLLGLLFSTYHYTTEMIGYSPLPCSAEGVSCLTRYVYEFGFVTIPFMGLMLFLLLTALITVRKYWASKIVIHS